MSGNLKILEVISSLSPMGGGETFAVNFSCCMKKYTNTKVVILHQNNRESFIKKLERNNVEYVVLDKKKHIDKKCQKQLKQIINEYKPDIIHTENNALLTTIFSMGILSKVKCPVFHTLHLEAKEECNSFYLRFLYKRFFKKKNVYAVSLSKKLADDTARFFKLKNSYFVENGVELSSFTNEIKLADRKFDIAVVGRFSKEKNHSFIVENLNRVITQYPNLKVVFVGDGPLFNDTKNLISSLKLEKNITLTGAVDNPAKYVKDSKIILLGSLYEANPLTLLEGMSAGCVVIAPNVGGISDIVEESKNGFLFEVGDGESMINNLQKVLINQSHFSEMSEYNATYAKRFSIDGCCNKYLDLFQGVAHER